MRAVSTAADLTASDDTTYTTGSLPDIVHVPTVGVQMLDRIQPGWTLTNLNDRSESPPPPCVAGRHRATPERLTTATAYGSGVESPR